MAILSSENAARASLTLRTVHLSALKPTTAIVPGAFPCGYTVSLLLFLFPIEEYAFLSHRFLCVLLLYLRLDQYCLAAYTIETKSATRKQFHRLLKFLPESLALVILLVAGAITYKKFSPAPIGFPGTSGVSNFATTPATG